MSEVVDPSSGRSFSAARKAFSCHGGHLHGAFSDVYIPLRGRIYTAWTFLPVDVKKRHGARKSSWSERSDVPSVDRGKVIIGVRQDREKSEASLIL